MSVEDHTLIRDPPRAAHLELGPERTGLPGLRRRARPRRPRHRIRRLRLALVALTFLGLAGASALFGMLTAVASDLPRLQNTAQFHERVDSYLYDASGRPIGVLAPPDDSVIDDWSQISPYMRDAIIAVEDKRFWSDPAIDLRGMFRALVSDVTGGPREGGSTIPEEFVKVVEGEEDNRTIFEKLREAGLAFQLVHRWTRKHILVSYLNTIYFGNGANGVEAAARTYFGWAHGYHPRNPAAEPRSGCGDPDAEDPRRSKCASELTPAQAALLAGMVANPSAFDPALHPRAALARRNLVLEDMYQQHYISRRRYEHARSRPLPRPAQIQQPQEPAAAPYFVSWVRPLIIRALQKDGIRSYQDAQYEALYGGLRVRLTLNLQLQQAAQQAVNAALQGSGGLSASLVAINNSNGEVRAMVSGDGDYQRSPFNLATLGYRQPGSAFKIFTLAAALSSGSYGPDSVIDSKPLRVAYRTRLGRTAYFNVHNFANAYAGPESLATATAVSDNSVFAQVGMHVGTKHIRSFAQAMGIRSPISTYPAMILGGLTTGVSALDLAHAYETAATGGYKLYNPVLGDRDQGPIGIASISNCGPCTYSKLANRPAGRPAAGAGHDIQDDLIARRVLTPQVAAEVAALLHGPVDDPSGTGTAAAIPGVDVAGKTGTTSNFVDAWFVGWTPQLTVAVWVGYPNSGKPMLKNFHGGPVEGGTYPAIIWHDFMTKALAISAERSSTGRSQTTAQTMLAPQTTPSSTPGPSSTPATTGAAQNGTSTASDTTGARQVTKTGGRQVSKAGATLRRPPEATGGQQPTGPPHTGGRPTDNLGQGQQAPGGTSENATAPGQGSVVVGGGSPAPGAQAPGTQPTQPAGGAGGGAPSAGSPTTVTTAPTVTAEPPAPSTTPAASSPTAPSASGGSGL